jgi:NADPH:quinone reductase-like Zn-dependent oxidoreductase
LTRALTFQSTEDMTPETMQAVKIVSVGKAEIQTVPLPELRDHYILVKVQAVAINPTDW